MILSIPININNNISDIILKCKNKNNINFFKSYVFFNITSILIHILQTFLLTVIPNNIVRLIFPNVVCQP